MADDKSGKRTVSARWMELLQARRSINLFACVFLQIRELNQASPKNEDPSSETDD